MNPRIAPSENDSAVAIDDQTHVQAGVYGSLVIDDRLLLLLDAQGAVTQFLSGGGEKVASRLSLEEADTQLGLEGTDTSKDGGMVHAERPCRSRE